MLSGSFGFLVRLTEKKNRKIQRPCFQIIVIGVGPGVKYPGAGGDGELPDRAARDTGATVGGPTQPGRGPARHGL